MGADVARRRLTEEIPHVGLKQVALEEGLQRGSRHRGYISLVTSVPLLQRQTRIARGQTLRPRVRERDHAADVVAHLPGVEPRRRDVPAEVRAERRVAKHRRYATQ